MTPPDPAAASVWQPPQPLFGEDLGAGAAFDFRRRRFGHAGLLADVGGDVVEILALDDVAGIEAIGLPLLGRGYSTWALTMPSTVAASTTDFARRGEGAVEARADFGRAPGLGQGVADAALFDEEGAAARRVGAGRPAAGGGDHDRARRARTRRAAGEFRSASAYGDQAGLSLYVGPPVPAAPPRP